MQVLRIYPNSINERHIAQAVDTLREGGLIVYPTDTVYAVGCDALNKRAIERLCRLKGLDPNKNLLSIVCGGLSQASEYVRIDNNAFRTVKNYLPGPYTFILPASTRLPKVFKDRKTVGLRVPDNAIATALAEALGNPLLTSSVELDDDNADDIVNAEALAVHYAPSVDLVIDGGDGSVTPSTIVDLTDASEPVVIREGAGQFDE